MELNLSFDDLNVFLFDDFHEILIYSRSHLRSICYNFFVLFGFLVSWNARFLMVLPCCTPKWLDVSTVSYYAGRS